MTIDSGTYKTSRLTYTWKKRCLKDECINKAWEWKLAKERCESIHEHDVSGKPVD